MLLPGYYIWDYSLERNEVGDVVQGLASSHPGWAHDMGEHAPWAEGDVIPEIGSFLRGKGDAGAPVIMSYSLESTMTSTASLFEAGVLPEWGSLMAVRQVAGRGQLRRPWVSSPGNVHASLVLPADSYMDAWSVETLNELRPILFGYIFCEILRSFDVDVMLKWPNDLLVGDRKVGGMLIEERNQVVILGLGLNLVESPAQEQMREDHSVQAGVLGMSHAPFTPLGLWENLVNRGKKMYAHLLDGLNPAEFVALASSRLAWMGRTVLVREGSQEPYRATIAGLSSHGGLVLSDRGRERELYSGSILPL